MPTTVVPDFEQIGFHYDRIQCPKCQKRQSAKVLDNWPQYAYFHTCVNCGHVITVKDWKSLKGQEA